MLEGSDRGGGLSSATHFGLLWIEGGITWGGLVRAIRLLRKTLGDFGHYALSLVLRSQNVFCFAPENDESFGDRILLDLSNSCSEGSVNLLF